MLLFIKSLEELCEDVPLAFGQRTPLAHQLLVVFLRVLQIGIQAGRHERDVLS